MPAGLVLVRSLCLLTEDDVLKAAWEEAAYENAYYLGDMRVSHTGLHLNRKNNR